jgi:hypothetical protein
MDAAPDRAEQYADPELTRGSAAEAAKARVGPIRNRTARNSKLGLKSRKHQSESDSDHQYRRDVAKHFGVEADGKADSCHEQADGNERDGKPDGKSNGSPFPLRCGSAEDDRENRQYAGRQDRQHAGRECKHEAPERHRSGPVTAPC